MDQMKKQDKETFIKICQSMDVDLGKEKIVETIRLGKKREDGSSRPLVVRLSNPNLKGTIFKNTAKLSQNKYKDISIANDLTKIHVICT